MVVRDCFARSMTIGKSSSTGTVVVVVVVYSYPGPSPKRYAGYHYLILV
jgi:hypothetical protein